MSSTIKNIVSNLEDLISEASKSNTEIISETTKFLSNMDKSKLNPSYLGNLQQGLFTEAIQKITALNVNYAKELMRVGVELSKMLNSGENTGEETSTGPDKSSVAAFEIKMAARAGETATTAFLLNSDKDEAILCKVQNEPYQLQTEEGVIQTDFATTYSPQLFELLKGVAQRVDASIEIPSETTPGIYKSKITVAGFEHTHFDLTLEVMEAAIPSPAPPKRGRPKKAAEVKTEETKSTSSTKKPAAKTSTRKTTTRKTTARKATTRKTSSKKSTNTDDAAK